MGSFATTLFKTLFLILNIILILCGIASLAGGIYLAVAPEHFLKLTELGAIGLGQVGLVRTCGYLLIGAGGAGILIALVGILAVKRESGCLYATYGVIMMLVLGVELSALVVGILYQEEWQSRLKRSIQTEIDEQFDGKLDTDNTFTAAINKLQQDFDCCGISNASDFKNAVMWNRTTESGEMEIPPSCCHDYKVNDTCVTMPVGDNSYASRGCWETIEDKMNEYSILIIIIAAVTVGIELFLIICSICLVGTTRSGYDLEKK